MRIKVERGYEELARVLLMALEQAQGGKGKERHANGMVFSSQSIIRLPTLQKSTKGLIYQVCKKAIESENLPELNRKVAERLGAIVYLAASILVEHELERMPISSAAQDIADERQADRAIKACEEADKYLSRSGMESIGSGSILHKMLAAGAEIDLPF